jgi:hypothetical protein
MRAWHLGCMEEINANLKDEDHLGNLRHGLKGNIEVDFKDT